ncbi:MAG TPA: LPP20 family lipoprotein [Smithella sp.]|nr:LPP20 family lipoprotein [Smithella sp.]
MNSRLLIKVICIAVLVSSGIILYGCATQPVTPTAIDTVMKNEFVGAPDWVTKDCASYIKDDKKICGVGSVGGTRNPSIARTTGVARAKTEIARTLQTRVTAMLKDYQATTSGGEYFGKYASDEQHVVDVSKQITEMTLSGVEQKETWISKNGIYYVLVTLNVEKFKNIVQNMHSLPESVRKAVVQRADKAFGELNRESDKMKENY